MSTIYTTLKGTQPMADPLFDIKGRSVVVAGAAGYLGCAVVRALAARRAYFGGWVSSSRDAWLEGIEDTVARSATPWLEANAHFATVLG
jgi:nucleoside-diphosphate-sugar epimerase